MILSHNVAPFKAYEVTNRKFPVGNSGLGNKLVVYCSPAQLRAAAVLPDRVRVTPISSQLQFTPNPVMETDDCAPKL